MMRVGGAFMSTINADKVRELRRRVEGAKSLQQCARALRETHWDVDAAQAWLNDPATCPFSI
jgi:translation elongation factor EF-Ts